MNEKSIFNYLHIMARKSRRKSYVLIADMVDKHLESAEDIWRNSFTSLINSLLS